MSPLHQAIEHQEKFSVIELLEKGADPNQTADEVGGFRPLHLAIDIECEDACRRYDGGDKNAQPLALLTELLLQAGANPNLPDERGTTAWDMARERNHQQALSLFSKIARPQSAKSRRCNRRWFLKHGAKMILPLILGTGVGAGAGAALAVALHSSTLGFALGIGIGIATAFTFAVVIRKKA